MLGLLFSVIIFVHYYCCICQKRNDGVFFFPPKDITVSSICHSVKVWYCGCSSYWPLSIKQKRTPPIITCDGHDTCLLTSLLLLSVHVKCVSFKSRSTSYRANDTEWAHVDIKHEVFCRTCRHSLRKGIGFVTLLGRFFCNTWGIAYCSTSLSPN